MQTEVAAPPVRPTLQRKCPTNGHEWRAHGLRLVCRVCGETMAAMLN